MKTNWCWKKSQIVTFSNHTFSDTICFLKTFIATFCWIRQFSLLDEICLKQKVNTTCFFPQNFNFLKFECSANGWAGTTGHCMQATNECIISAMLITMMNSTIQITPPIISTSTTSSRRKQPLGHIYSYSYSYNYTESTAASEHSTCLLLDHGSHQRVEAVQFSGQ